MIIQRDHFFSLLLLFLLLAPVGLAQRNTTARRLVSQRFQRLTRAATWQLRATIPLKFNTYHPQGMVKIGAHFFLSAVEVTQPTKRYAQPQGKLDRDTGAGTGHLFQFDEQGKLLADIRLGTGACYHPSGIDYDGQFIWVAVAEYRPHSRSLVYRVNPVTHEAILLFAFADHLGSIIHDRATRTLHAVSWGSRTFYRWRLDARGRVRNAEQPLQRINPSFYVDYQDCKALGRQEMLCAGLSQYRVPSATSASPFRLGGMDLLDLRTARPLYQLPIEQWTPNGTPMTQNPFWLEATANGLRAYFVPEDGQSQLYVFDVR